MSSLDDIVIVGAARTPIGRFQGAYRELPATDLGAAAIRAALARAGVEGALVDECIMGNVVSAGLGQAPARQAALRGGLPETVGALTINKVCGSGLKAVMLGAALIRSGDARLVVAGGMENMSRAPYLLPQGRAGFRLGHAQLLDSVIHDGLWCAFEDQHMGSAAEWIAREQGVDRASQDAFALRSHQLAIAAQDAGHFAEEIVPVEAPDGRATALVSADEPPRRDSSLEALGRLKPAFAPDGTVTAGNAPGITDGASALALTSMEQARALGLRPLARVVASAQAALPPLQVFAAPVLAVRRLLERTRTSVDDYDLFEINEAFAAQVVANSRALGIDMDRLNVNGGAIALGHPIGASGARVLITLIYALRRRSLRRGMAVLCLGGGEAVALSVEAL